MRYEYEEPEYEDNCGIEDASELEEESLVEVVHNQLINLVKNGTTEKVQLMAINLALQFLRDLDLESGSDAYDDKDEEDIF